MGRWIRRFAGSRPGVGLVASLITLLVVGGVTVARASIPDSSGVIHACYKTTSGALAVINTAKTSTCPSGNGSVSWPTSTGWSGLREFTSSGTWTPPEDVTRVLIEAWGGGGGGGGYYVNSPSNCAWGGGGGAGAYLRAVVPVKAGQSYTVIVGAAGIGGASAGAAGGSGGNSMISTNTTVLLIAGGGKGGSSGTTQCPVPGGVGGTGSFASGGLGLVRAGHPGQSSDACHQSCVPAGGQPVIEGFTPGAVGLGGNGNDAVAGDAINGQAGYLLLSW